MRVCKFTRDLYLKKSAVPSQSLEYILIQTF
jgi:hypothetical protein